MAIPNPKVLPVGDTVEQQLPAFFASYKGMSPSTPSSWIVFNNDGKYKLRFGEACHANMKYDGTGWDDIYSCYPKSDKISLAYIRMLINGPFKGFSDLVQLKKHTILGPAYHDVKKDCLEQKKDTYYYLHCTDLEDWPANVLYNFLIASRIPTEKNAWLAPWWKGVELGFNPVLSFLLTFSTDGKPYEGKRFEKMVSNHNWFDNSSDWGRIIKGDMARMSKTFKSNPSSASPCNVIWDKSKDTSKFAQMTAEQVSDFFGLAIEPPAADPPKPAARPKYGMKKFYGGILAQAQFNHNFAAPPNPVPIPPGGGFVDNIDQAAAHLHQLLDNAMVPPAPPNGHPGVIEWHPPLWNAHALPADPQPQPDFDEDNDIDDDFEPQWDEPAEV